MQAMGFLFILIILVFAVWKMICEEKTYKYEDIPYQSRSQPNTVPEPLGEEFRPFYRLFELNGKSRIKRCNRHKFSFKAKLKRKRK